MSRNYEDWLLAFLDYGQFSEAPNSFLFWTGVSTIAGALRRRVWVDMKLFQWVGNFYIILVAPPGVVSKTTTINVGMHLLKQLDTIKFGPDVVTWQALVGEFEKAQEEVFMPAEQMYEPMSCLTLASGEFGNFLNPQDKEMVNLLISLWDGQKGAFSKMTKMSGNNNIVNPWVNIIACTTPHWIADNFPEHMIGGGFTSRCVFVYADRKRQYVAYPDEAAPEEYYDQRQKLVHDLEIISQLVGEMKLTAEAREWGEWWYKSHWTSNKEELDNPQFGGYLARKQTHIHKLAMILSAARRDDLIIDQRTLTDAASFIDGIEKDMPKIYSHIGQNDLTKAAHQIVDIVSRNPKGIDHSTLYSHLFRSVTYKDFAMALQSAINAGKVVQQQMGQQLVIRIRQ